MILLLFFCSKIDLPENSMTFGWGRMVKSVAFEVITFCALTAAEQFKISIGM